MSAPLRELRMRLQALERPRAPEPLPVRIGRRRIYVLPTRFGLFYGLLVAGMALGALNYNNNPALLLALLLGAAGLASLIAAHLQLSGLHLDAVSAEPVAAGDPLWLRLTLSCRDGRRRRGLRGDVDGADAWAATGEDGMAELSLPVPTRRRGWLHPGRVRLSTTQPLGLARAWSRVWPRQPLLVYPRAEPGAPPLPDTGTDAQCSQVHPLGDEPHQLRAYRAGDPRRSVAWKHSARRGSLVVREYERARQQDVVLDWGGLRGLAYEARVSRLAAWVDMAEREGRRYRLQLPAQPPLGPGNGPEHHHACLRALALLPGAT
ncbi:DUF58 domain-containing protein [Pseudoxanthomonas sp. 10H]|uniref:DUF58 domain-containing protein n=1 Tax=Pseudoxanthomonas sp. 10H TaxID=3242729 RepID=UPI003558DCE3